MSSPWPEDYYTPVAEMDTNHILKSTLTGESRQQKEDSRTCLLCGFSYFFRPIRARYHLGLGSVSKKVQKYKPSAEHIERHAEVVNELKRRDEHEKIQAREMVSSTWKSLGKGLDRLTMRSHVHPRRSEKERRYEVRTYTEYLTPPSLFRWILSLILFLTVMIPVMGTWTGVRHSGSTPLERGICHRDNWTNLTNPLKYIYSSVLWIVGQYRRQLSQWIHYTKEVVVHVQSRKVYLKK